jgi:taurine dioxygenase
MVMAAGITVEPIDERLTFGARVHGLSRAMLRDPAIRARIDALLTEHGFVLFPGLDGVEAQIELSEIFGPLKRHTLPTVINDEARPELLEINYVPGVGGTVEIDGRARGSYLPWHFDDSYHDVLNRGGVFRPVTLPDEGGATGFIDRAAALAALPDDLRRQIEGRSVLYALQLDLAKQRFGRHPGLRVLTNSDYTKAIMARAGELPRAIHPLVCAKPDDGRMVLNFSPWYAVEIAGMAPADSAELLDLLSDHIITGTRPLIHRWRMGEMGAWDNWRLLHSGIGGPADQVRRLQRTTIQGNYTHGRFEGGRRPAFELAAD